MATVPLSGTNITLMSGVPFSNDYKNTRWFDDINSQSVYFQNKPVVMSISESKFQRIEGRHFIKVNESIDNLWGTNYLMFQNASYNNKWFYGFVTKLEYVNPSMTNIHFQIDVLQTWMFDMNFKPSYVVREHCNLWVDDAKTIPTINTVEEGLNYGTEYDVVSIDNYIPYEDTFYLVIVSKTLLHGANVNTYYSSQNGLPQPLNFYIHPFKLDGTMPNVYIDNTIFVISDILDVYNSIYKTTSAVNNIVSLFVTDHIGLNPTAGTTDPNTHEFNSGIVEGVTISDGTTNNIKTLHVKMLPSYSATSKDFGSKYSGFRSVKESKLLMYPYTVTVLDDFRGNRIELKNEYINMDNLVIEAKGSIGISNNVAYGVNGYLNSLLSGADQDTDNLEHWLINNNPNDVPIISDYLSAYLQGNKNSIQNQKQSALLNGALGVAGSVIGGVASAAMGNEIGMASSGVNAIGGVANTALKIQGINAKIKDARNVPPSLVKMGSNTQFDYGNGYKGLYIIKKQITPEYQTKLEDFFNMFGYKLNEVKIPNFHTRINWNYIQTESCNITGNFNNEDLKELKQIFDNGVTLWHTDDVGNYTLDNGVI